MTTGDIEPALTFADRDLLTRVLNDVIHGAPVRVLGDHARLVELRDRLDPRDDDIDRPTPAAPPVVMPWDPPPRSAP